MKKRRRREIERVHITRVLAVAAGHGCFHLCPSALSKEGQVTQQVLHFIGGIKLVKGREGQGKELRERERERDGGWEHASYMYMYICIVVNVHVHMYCSECTCTYVL